MSPGRSQGYASQALPIRPHTSLLPQPHVFSSGLTLTLCLRSTPHHLHPAAVHRQVEDLLWTSQFPWPAVSPCSAVNLPPARYRRCETQDVRVTWAGVRVTGTARLGEWRGRGWGKGLYPSQKDVDNSTAIIAVSMHVRRRGRNGLGLGPRSGARVTRRTLLPQAQSPSPYRAP